MQYSHHHCPEKQHCWIWNKRLLLNLNQMQPVYWCGETSLSDSVKETYHGGAVSATPTSVGAAEALVRAAGVLAGGDPGCGGGCTPASVGSQSALGGDGELPSCASRPRIIGGGAMRCLAVYIQSTSKTFLHIIFIDTVCMHSRVYVTVGCPSVCPVDRLQQWCAAGLLLGTHHNGATAANADSVTFTATKADRM